MSASLRQADGSHEGEPRLQAAGSPPTRTLCPSSGNSPGSSVRVTRKRQRLWRLTCTLSQAAKQAAAPASGAALLAASGGGGAVLERAGQAGIATSAGRWAGQGRLSLQAWLTWNQGNQNRENRICQVPSSLEGLHLQPDTHCTRAVPIP